MFLASFTSPGLHTRLLVGYEQPPLHPMTLSLTLICIFYAEAWDCFPQTAAQPWFTRCWQFCPFVGASCCLNCAPDCRWGAFHDYTTSKWVDFSNDSVFSGISVCSHFMCVFLFSFKIIIILWKFIRAYNVNFLRPFYNIPQCPQVVSLQHLPFYY